MHTLELVVSPDALVDVTTRVSVDPVSVLLILAESARVAVSRRVAERAYTFLLHH